MNTIKYSTPEQTMKRLKEYYEAKFESEREDCEGCFGYTFEIIIKPYEPEVIDLED
jgi:hypothetical protein